MDLDISSTKELNNQIKMPIFGLGTWPLKGKSAYNAVLWALDSGYSLIDTASFYGNESEIGDALKDTKMEREEIFITTKVWNSEQGYDNTLEAFNNSLRRLKLDYIDLYLMHWPVSDLRNETWRALEKIYEEGRVRAIGVSNFTIRHLNELLESSNSVPTVNQIEFSPFLYQKELMEYCQSKNIAVEAYTPLIRERKFKNKVVVDISQKWGKTPAQILIRWGLQHNIIEIPKTGSKEHLIENADIFDFNLDNDDMSRLDNLHEDYRLVDDPHRIR
ncbi:MAG: aldo/keto reductase [Promethearchaeota archaeon]|jgi:diketogulonate reductase-like aldo/keto reductase